MIPLWLIGVGVLIYLVCFHGAERKDTEEGEMNGESEFPQE